jgi:hypothetical protein
MQDAATPKACHDSRIGVNAAYSTPHIAVPLILGTSSLAVTEASMMTVVVALALKVTPSIRVRAPLVCGRLS